jgi:hypothetical protein
MYLRDVFDIAWKVGLVGAPVVRPAWIELCKSHRQDGRTGQNVSTGYNYRNEDSTDRRYIHFVCRTLTIFSMFSGLLVRKQIPFFPGRESRDLMSPLLPVATACSSEQQNMMMRDGCWSFLGCVFCRDVDSFCEGMDPTRSVRFLRRQQIK